MKNSIIVERAKLKITQEELVNEVGVCRITIHNIEAGKCEPKLSLALKIVKFFGLKVLDVFEEEVL